ncbi:hypothetical protein GWI33_002319 [Rhynchophorus ferrugineus]|uniref:Peptidase S1 domain-containing protein n=1 Tax=Rhynchophorus ferrugineus TaxID=354439 RepID=A0A834MJN0_RHYFE|nr:hypothetical protein GWI33_002319 [Rhynchophorus ferrugineus]
MMDNISIISILLAVVVNLHECQEIATENITYSSDDEEFVSFGVVGGTKVKIEWIHAANGTSIPILEYPHMVALGYGDETNLKWLCGGTLISNQFVLTAAHCIAESLNPLKTIRINSATLDNPTEAYTDIEVEKTYIHPNYNLSSQYDDIALLKLNKIAPGYARPAQLHNTTDIPSNILTATGWGRTDFAGPTSNDLLEVVLKTYTFSECSAFYRKNNRLANGLDDNTQLCAGGEGEEVKDTCNGDSGGPLSYKIENTHYIAGITSFGKACGLVNVPAVYTRVSAYVPWIESIVQIK